jgi:type IV pilus assembly protein PilX
MSLFPALMFLLVLAVLGVSALNSTLMQEKMVSNTKDANLAFQAAEAGLRDGEADIDKNKTFWTPTTFTSSCTSGLCTPPSTWPTPD